MLIGVGLGISKRLEAFFSHALAKIAISELTKAVQGNSSIISFEPSCYLDDALSEEPTRESLKLWRNRANV